jgi:hypothetical protein
MGEPTTDASFARVFDDALRGSGLTMTDVRSRLAARGHRVAASTLGYWRSGQRQPERAESLDAVAEIEAILRVRPGTLAAAIGASRRSGRPLASAPVEQLPDMTPAVVEALAALDLEEPHPGHVEEAGDVVADVDRNGDWVRMLTRTRLRARADGVTRSVAYCVDRPGTAALEVVVGGGATLGRQVRMEEHGLLMAELLLERPLDLGDTAMVEYSFTFAPADEPDCELGSYASNRMADIGVWARFHPERTPSRGFRFSQTTDEDEQLVEVDLGGGTSLHHALRRFGPGVMGVRWEW